MPQLGLSGSMSGERKRSVAAWPKLPRLSSTLPDATVTSTMAQVPLKRPEDIKRYIDALKQAGLRDS